MNLKVEMFSINLNLCLMKITIIPETTLEGSEVEKLNSFQLLSENFVSVISEQLKLKRLSKSWLAGKLKVSAPAVTKMLASETNPTLKTIADVADALNLRVELKFTPKRNLLQKLEDDFSKSKTRKEFIVNSNLTKE